MKTILSYEEPKPINRDAAEKLLSSDDPRAIGEALLRLSLNDHNSKYTERQCLEAFKRDDKRLNRVAMTSLVHLARLHGSLNLKVVEPILRRFISSKDRDLANAAAFDLEEILLHMKKWKKTHKADKKRHAS